MLNLVVYNMTFDGGPPSKESIAYDKLRVNIDLRDVLSELYDDRFFSEDAHVDYEGVDEVSRDDLEERIFELLLRKTRAEADDTLAWENGKHGMDPAHESEYISEVLDDIELEEFAGQKLEEIMEEVDTHTDSDGVLRYVDLEVQLT